MNGIFIIWFTEANISKWTCREITKLVPEFVVKEEDSQKILDQRNILFLMKDRKNCFKTQIDYYGLTELFPGQHL